MTHGTNAIRSLKEVSEIMSARGTRMSIESVRLIERIALAKLRRGLEKLDAHDRVSSGGKIGCNCKRGS